MDSIKTKHVRFLHGRMGWDLELGIKNNGRKEDQKEGRERGMDEWTNGYGRKGGRMEGREEGR